MRAQYFIYEVNGKWKLLFAMTGRSFPKDGDDQKIFLELCYERMVFEKLERSVISAPGPH